MAANRTTDQRLDDLEEAVAGVMEETTGLRGEVDELKQNMERKFDEQGEKLDKILEVVLAKEKRTDERLTRLERINGIVAGVQ